MTNQQIRIAVAEVMGHVEPACYGNLGWLSKAGHGKVEFVPNYPADLNACHEMEKVLTRKQRIEARWHLVQITDDNYDTWGPHEYNTLGVWEVSLTDIDACLNATARQRCEAFLRTLGKWSSP